ncbi:hypothetical protein FB45DRAFT_1065534 [Roridomyces roridus]|uniref:F-box domain-containing protein n=1 Tax=Roridomyces roridus TaxID=1738132 RepID=A0AAD7B7E4_9AGAR|nr:hypothetical protein FB45DRAFT_1065534 [Roridomyces roridus]
MVLTRRAYKARMLITRWLPNEVLAEIIEHLPREDQATLCRASKLFHALTLPVLTRTVAFAMNQVVKSSPWIYFCLGVVEHPERGAAVRSFTFTDLTYRPKYRDSAYVLLFDSLALMNGLEYLSLDSYAAAEIILPELARLTFPRLTSFRLTVSERETRGSDVAEFLTRHLTLTRLRLWDVDSTRHPVRSSDWTNPFLPNIQHYCGPPEFLHGFSTRSLQSAWIITPDSRNLKAVRSLMDPEQPFALTTITRHGETETDLASVAKDLSSVTSLQILRWVISRVDLVQMNQVTSYLARLTRLKYFTLGNFNHGDYFEGFVMDASRDPQVIETWAEACPTLKSCCLSLKAWRKAEGGWEECTKETYDIEAGFVTFD